MITLHTPTIYTEPILGDVALMSLVYSDDTHPDVGPILVKIPVEGNRVWWHLVREHPLLVQQAFERCFAAYCEAKQARDALLSYPEEATEGDPYDSDDPDANG